MTCHICATRKNAYVKKLQNRPADRRYRGHSEVNLSGIALCNRRDHVEDNVGRSDIEFNRCNVADRDFLREAFIHETALFVQLPRAD